MPCYNARLNIEEAVGSILAQTYPEWELIVVDDGSTDGSYEVIKNLAENHSDRMRIFRQKNQGQWVARNAALRQSRGKYIACLDADDYWRKDFLEKMISPLSRDAADISYCGWQNFGYNAPGIKPYLPPAYEEDDPVKAFLITCPWPIHAALCRWEVFEKLELFSERHLRSMDYDFWLRTLSIGVRYRRVGHVLAFYRWDGQGQMSDAKAIQALNVQEIKERFVRNHSGLVAHISSRERKYHMFSQCKRKAYELYWAGEMNGAQKLFWLLAIRGALSRKDIRYAIISFLPIKLKILSTRLRDYLVGKKKSSRI
jgi:glycosyltransferase involved in cell wall biosynthesis